MDWLLPVVSIVGLSIAVLVLGWTVVFQTTWSKRQQNSHNVRQTQQDQLDASKDDAVATGEINSRPSMPSVPRGFRNPRQTFKEAFRDGDRQSATAVLPELKRVLGAEHQEYLLAAGALAAVGEQSALQPLNDVIDSGAVHDEPLLKSIFASVVQYYVATDRELDGLNEVEAKLKRYVDDVSWPNEFRSFLANQLSMLYYGAEKTDDALVSVNLAIRLNAEEPAYYHNLSLIHEKRNEIEEAIEAINRCLEKSGNEPDRDHLFQALDLHRQIGNSEKMKTLQGLLDRSDQ